MEVQLQEALSVKHAGEAAKFCGGRPCLVEHKRSRMVFISLSSSLSWKRIWVVQAREFLSKKKKTYVLITIVLGRSINLVLPVPKKREKKNLTSVKFNKIFLNKMVQKPGSTQRPKPVLTAATNTGISKIIYSTSALLGYNWAAFTLDWVRIQLLLWAEFQLLGYQGLYIYCISTCLLTKPIVVCFVESDLGQISITCISILSYLKCNTQSGKIFHTHPHISTTTPSTTHISMRLNGFIELKLYNMDAGYIWSLGNRWSHEWMCIVDVQSCHTHSHDDDPNASDPWKQQSTNAYKKLTSVCRNHQPQRLPPGLRPETTPLQEPDTKVS